MFFFESYFSKRGSEGLINYILLTLKNIIIEDIAKQNLIRLNTDGESANTSKNSSLCVRFREYVNREILCLWCIAHQSVLAFVDLQSSVMKLKHWNNTIEFGRYA